jgi:hypothetical protein
VLWRHSVQTYAASLIFNGRLSVVMLNAAASDCLLAPVMKRFDDGDKQIFFQKVFIELCVIVKRTLEIFWRHNV